jgi:hypothetical protein
MNIWNTPQDIDAMTSDQWHIYRDDLLDEYYRRGYVLRPNVGCRSCDPRDDYTCLDCEINQVDSKREI